MNFFWLFLRQNLYFIIIIIIFEIHIEQFFMPLKINLGWRKSLNYFFVITIVNLKNMDLTKQT